MPRRTVTITGVHLALVPDRQATLQPAYVFETEGDIGMITPIPAVQDQFLAP